MVFSPLCAARPATLWLNHPSRQSKTGIHSTFQLAVQSLHPCPITTSDNPADSSAAVTIQRLEDPSFGFLRPETLVADFLNACGHNSLIGAGRREVKQLG